MSAHNRLPVLKNRSQFTLNYPKRKFKCLILQVILKFQTQASFLLTLMLTIFIYKEESRHINT